MSASMSIAALWIVIYVVRRRSRATVTTGTGIDTTAASDTGCSVDR